MDVPILAYLPDNLSRYGFGAAGTAWLAELPRHIAELAQEWGLRVGPPFAQDGSVSWVAPVELRDGAEAVLKVTVPHDDPRFEAAALRVLDGRGAVRLLRASDDGFALLLVVGEPAYDLAQWLFNRARFVIGADDAVAVLRQQAERFASDLGLDPARIAGWAFVKALGWECGPEYVTLFGQVAQSW